MHDMIDILVIDDEIDTCHYLSDILEKRGYRVCFATSGEAGVQLASEKHFAVALVDIILPGINGLEIIKKFKMDISPLTEVVIITNYGNLLTVVQAMEIDAFSLLNKPFESETKILLTVDRAVHRWRMKLNEERWGSLLKAKLEKQAKEISNLYSIISELNIGFDINTILEDIVVKAMSILQSEVGSLMLLDSDNKELHAKVIKGLPDGIKDKIRVKLGEDISGWVAANKKPLLCKDVRKDPRFKREPHERYYTHSLISAPLMADGELFGVLNINNKKDKSAYNQEDVRILEILATQAAFALNKAQLYKKLERSYVNVVALLINIIEARDDYTYAHSERVARLAGVIAKRMGFTGKDLENLTVAARLHDLGKIVIAETILAKKGPLNDEEWRKIRLHPQIGYRLLSPLNLLSREITNVIYQHHERYDGDGYPNGIVGEDISLGARIVSVADSFEAMTSSRPHRNALPRSKAIDELKRERGKQFDPKIVDTFLSCFCEAPFC